MSTLRRTVMGLLAGLLVTTGCSKKEEAPAGGQISPKSLAAAGQELSLPPAAELPPGVLGYLLVNDLNTMLQNAEKLGGLMAPLPPGSLSMALSQVLVQARLKDTSVIDLTGTAGVLVLDPKKHSFPLVFAVPIKGEQELLKSMEPAWKKKGEEHGILEVQLESLDTYGVFKGGSAEAAPTTSQPMFLKFSGKTVLAAPAKETLVEGAAILEKCLNAAPARGTMVGSLRLDNVRKVFVPELDQASLGMKQALQDRMAAVGQSNPGVDWLLNRVAEWMMSWVGQVHELSFALGLPENGGLFQLALAPEKDSTFSKLLAVQKHDQPLALHGLMPSEGLISGALNIQWQPFKQEILAFGTEASKALLGQEIPEPWLALMRDFYDVIGDELAFYEDLGDGLSLVEVFAVQDDEKARTLFTKVLALAGEMMAKLPKERNPQKFGFSQVIELGKHDGVALQAIDMTFDTASLPPGQAEMMKKMYGDKMRLVFAIFDKVFGLAMGRNGEKDMQALIDRSRKHGPGLRASAAFQNAAGGLDQDAGGFMYFSFSKIMSQTLQQVYGSMGQDPPGAKLDPAVSGMFFRFRSTPERLVLTARIPADHLKEAGKALQAVTQASMAAPPPPPPTP